MNTHDLGIRADHEEIVPLQVHLTGKESDSLQQVAYAHGMTVEELIRSVIGSLSKLADLNPICSEAEKLRSLQGVSSSMTGTSARELSRSPATR